MIIEFPFKTNFTLCNAVLEGWLDLENQTSKVAVWRPLWRYRAGHVEN